MDKQAIRRSIREQKRAMTTEQIMQASARLGELLAESSLYRNAKTIYGYLPYNQEVRTVPMLERALRDGKRVAVPKIYGDEMKFGLHSFFPAGVQSLRPGGGGLQHQHQST